MIHHLLLMSLCAGVAVAAAEGEVAPGAPAVPAASAVSAMPTVPTADQPAARAPDVTSTPALRLISGDQLHVEVYDNPDLTQTLRVGPDATAFPQLDSIGSLVGMTPTEVRDVLMKRLADGILRHPQVTVEVTALAERAVAVLGAVRNPQRIPIAPFSALTALHAIAEAGGLLEEAARGQLTLLRRNAATVTMIDADAVGLADPALENGDILLVPRLDRVFVLGEVTRPGPLSLTSDKPLTLAQAISSAGGFTRSARAGKVRLLRGSHIRNVDVSALLTGSDSDDPALRPGDVIFVPDSLF